MSTFIRELWYRFFFDIDVKEGEVLFATDDKELVITSTTCIHNLKVVVNAKGGDCWNYDRYCNHMETDHIVIWLSLMAKHRI